MDSSVPVHIPSALSDFSEFSKKSKDGKLGVGVVDGCCVWGIVKEIVYVIIFYCLCI